MGSSPMEWPTRRRPVCRPFGQVHAKQPSLTARSARYSLLSSSPTEVSERWWSDRGHYHICAVRTQMRPPCCDYRWLRNKSSSLNSPKFLVNTQLLQEFNVRALVNHAAILDYQNAVHRQDSGEAMGDNNDRFPLHKFF